MRSFVSLLLLTLTAWISPVAAGEKPEVRTVYSATVAGMNCLQCKRLVKKSLSGLEGVDKSSFTMDPGAVAGTTVVSFASTSAKLTREQAVRSLGEHAARYVITEFGPTGTAPAPPAKGKKSFGKKSGDSGAADKR